MEARVLAFTGEKFLTIFRKQCSSMDYEMKGSLLGELLPSKEGCDEEQH